MRLKLNLLEQKLLFALLVTTMIVMVVGNQGLNYPLFLFFNVLLTIQATQKQTIGTSSKRIGGTILGSILGILFYYYLPHNPLVIILYVGLAVILSYFFFEMYVGIVGIIGIMLIVDAAGGLPIPYVAGRLLGALLGTAIAVMSVSLIIQVELDSYKKFVAAADELKQLIKQTIVTMYTTSLDRHILEEEIIPKITGLRELRYTLLDEDNDITQHEDTQMSRIISSFADIYMHMRLINRTGGGLTVNSMEMLESQLQQQIYHEKHRAYENDILLNIHSQKLALALEQLSLQLRD